MAKASRDKGKRGERELARLLQEELGNDMIQRAADQTRDGDGDLLVGPFVVEVKRAKQAQHNAWWTQAKKQALTSPPGVWPALAWRLDRMTWRIRVPLGLFSLAAPIDGGIEWTADLSVPGFCAVVREMRGNDAT